MSHYHGVYSKGRMGHYAYSKRGVGRHGTHPLIVGYGPCPKGIIERPKGCPISDRPWTRLGHGGIYGAASLPHHWSTRLGHNGIYGARPRAFLQR
jgi:hypothetical protein